MVMVKLFVLCWICLASARNGMMWPCAMKGTITMCPFFSAAIGASSALKKPWDQFILNTLARKTSIYST
ncbi:hypothetical protein GLYMA_14G043851v4 [Glycine max]|uniref:Secreted protein n=1 Tax=Glycine soja TaxID=3848 RepID=A0A445H1U7_GLYSO|nr:hypothetical protein GLYMA_14G043851v4 [Glycine max]KAH1093054.1 hypothetical protein GYH30_039001 [Glycine max]RZB67411.1 hypothetical protein D0Y65_037666 [Glycine soja]